MIRSFSSENDLTSTALKTFKKQHTESKPSAKSNKCSFCSDDRQEPMFGGGGKP